MINKILEEMKQVREQGDYKNYRTLAQVLIEYVGSEILRLSYSDLNIEIISRTNYISAYLISEIDCLNDIAKQTLNSKDYSNFKIVSQVNCDLRNLESKLLYIKDRKIDKNNSNTKTDR